MSRHTACTVLVAVVTQLLAGALPASAQGRPGVDFQDVPEVSSKRLGDITAALISAINSSDRTAVQAFIDDYTTPQYRNGQSIEARLQQFRTARWRMGNVRVRGERFWKGPPAGTYSPIVQDETTRTWWYLDLATVLDDDLRVSGFNYNPMTAPTFAEPSPLEADRLAGEIEKTVQSACARDAFSGAVLVALRAEIVATAVCGDASKTLAVRNTLNTKFSLASMNKMFTALVVMQLVERGQLSLSDDVSGLVDPAVLPDQISRQITVAQLLSHRSGVQSLAPDTQLAFEPGSQFRYSNSGMAALGGVIEEVTGEDYYSAVRRRIYEPTGMSSSESYVFDEVVDGDEMAGGFATPYDFVADGPSGGFQKSPLLTRPEMRRTTPRGGAAGGGFSTVLDLHKFAVALLDGSLVSPETLEAMWTDYSGFDTGFYGYGYGFEVYQTPEGRVIGHGGSAPGASASFLINTETGYIVVVLSNYGSAAPPIAKRLTDLMSGVGE
jgi:CubicO group peptidase (beta-lactamase class C family)